MWLDQGSGHVVVGKTGREKKGEIIFFFKKNVFESILQVVGLMGPFWDCYH